MDDLFKVIFKLEGDNSALLKSIDEVNSKYKEQSAELNKQMVALRTLQENEAALLKGRANSQNPTAIAKYNAEIDKTRKKIDETTKAVENLTVANQKQGKQTEALGKKIQTAFDKTKIDAARKEVDKLNQSFSGSEKPLQSLRAQLKDLKAQLAATTDKAEFEKLSQQAGHLKDKIDDASQAAQIFATGTPFQAVGNAFRGIAGDLLSMDFEGAAQKAGLLVKATKLITFESTVEAVKQLGTTLFSVGKALLLNPLFLIGATLFGIISNFKELTELGGPIGSFFKGIQTLINDLKDGFFKLTDAIGLTTHAYDEMHKQVADKFNKDIERELANIDRLIRLYQTLDKETKNLEIAKQRRIIRVAELEGNPLFAAEAQANQRGQALDEPTKKRIQELRDIIQAANDEINIINAEANKKAAKEEEDARNKRIEAMKAFLKQQAETNDEFNTNEAVADAEAADNKQSALEKAFENKKKLDDAEYEWDKAQTQKKIDLSIKQRLQEKEEADKAEQERKAQQQREVAALIDLKNQVISTSQQIISTKIAEVDRLAALQQKRVEDAKQIADKGNAELYELEQKRLDNINRQREIFVQRQQTLATVELIANTAIAVSKAAAQGGVAAAITIAAALVALTGGLIQARSIASQAAFYEGGYTGDGNPRDVSMMLGQKPYTYHKGEFVFDHKKTGKYKDIFQDIHEGNIDLLDWRRKVSAFESAKLIPAAGSGAHLSTEELEKKISKLIMVVQGQSTSVNLDENGLEIRFKNIRTRSEFLKNKLGRA